MLVQSGARMANLQTFTTRLPRWGPHEVLNLHSRSNEKAGKQPPTTPGESNDNLQPTYKNTL
jgi:hypothetical protein